jgi:phage terminase small subunit
MKGLTPRQSEFVRQYLVDLNAAQAAIRAGYSAKTAATCGPRLLRFAQVRKAVEEAQAKRAERLDLRADHVLHELVRVARVDIGDAFDEQGRLKPLKDIPEDTRRAIAGIETDELYAGGGDNRVEIGQTRKLKFYDKVKALELLARHFGLLRDKVELAGAGGGALTVEVKVIGGDE